MLMKSKLKYLILIILGRKKKTEFKVKVNFEILENPFTTNCKRWVVSLLRLDVSYK